jgi:hypothetical protein
MTKLIDYDPATSLIFESQTTSEKETVTVDISPKLNKYCDENYLIEGLSFINGHSGTGEEYLRYSRAKAVELEFQYVLYDYDIFDRHKYFIKKYTVSLEDKRQLQFIKFPYPFLASRIRFTIIDRYPGRENSATALSEVIVHPFHSGER